MDQITETQLSIITETVNETGAFTQMVPEKDKDSAEDYANWMRGCESTNALVTLGFLNEITDKCSETLGRLKGVMGRDFKVYEATQIAMQMFKGETNDDAASPRRVQ